MYKTWNPRDMNNTTMWHIYRQWGSWQEVRSMTPDPDDPESNTKTEEPFVTFGVTSTLGVTFADPEVTSTKAVSTDLIAALDQSEAQPSYESAEQSQSEKRLGRLSLIKSFKKKMEAQKGEVKHHQVQKGDGPKRDGEQKPEVGITSIKASFKKKVEGFKSDSNKRQEGEKADLDKCVESKADDYKKSLSKKNTDKVIIEKPFEPKYDEPKKSSLKKSNEKLEIEKRLEGKNTEVKRSSLKKSEEKAELEKRSCIIKRDEPKKSSLKNNSEKQIAEKRLEEKHEEPKKSSLKKKDEKTELEKLYLLRQESKKSLLKCGPEKSTDHSKAISRKPLETKLENGNNSLLKRAEPKKSSLKRKTEKYLKEMEKTELQITKDQKQLTLKQTVEKQPLKKLPSQNTAPDKPMVSKQKVHKPKLPNLEIIPPGLHRIDLDGSRTDIKVGQTTVIKPLVNTLVVKKIVTLKRSAKHDVNKTGKVSQKQNVKPPDVTHSKEEGIKKEREETPERQKADVGLVDYVQPQVEVVTLREASTKKQRHVLSRNASTGSEFECLNSHAMRIVRTVGQAFEVCHKLSLQMAAQAEEGNEAGSEKSSDENEVRAAQNALPSQLEQEMLKYIISQSPDKAIMVDSSPGAEVSTQPQSPDEAFLQAQAQALLQTVSSKPQALGTISSPTSPQLALDDPFAPSAEDLPLSSHHQMQLLRQQLEQQQQQTQVAIAQVHLLKDQLSAETAARIEAQARTHQLLLQNRELLEHINSLVGRLQELEIKVTGMPSSELGMVRASPQIPLLSDPTTPTPGKVFLPEFAEREAKEATLSRMPDDATFENTNIKKEQAESPDSGHKEMSSDSLAYNLSQPETNLWYSPMSKLNGTVGDASGASSKRSSTASTNNNTTTHPASRPTSASFGAFDHQFSPRPLNTTGVNVHGQEFHLQMKTSVSSTAFSSRISQATAALGRSDSTTTTDSAKKMITPAPSQDATGNRLELNVRHATPKLNPPPKITKRIASRSPSFRTEVSTSPDSSNNNYSSHSSTTSETSLNGGVTELTKRHSRDSARFSATDENLNRESKELNTLPRTAKKDALLKETADRNMNNLSHSPNTKKSSLISAADSTTKLHLSFSDEENTENSEDSGVTLQPQTLDSMTFDEFEALSSS